MWKQTNGKLCNTVYLFVGQAVEDKWLSQCRVANKTNSVWHCSFKNSLNRGNDF